MEPKTIYKIEVAVLVVAWSYFIGFEVYLAGFLSGWW